jgi:hypothetical protein
MWRKLASTETDGRPIRPLPTNGIMHTGAADVGFGGTLDVDGNPGHPRKWQDQEIWQWKDKAECVSVRELKAIRMVLMRTLGERVKKEGIFLLRLCVDNSSVVHVPNAFVASSKPMMRELRRLKKVLDKLGLQLSSEWIPSVANKFADALSRHFSPGVLAVRQTLRRSVVDGMMAPLDSFPLRPLGEHPVFLRPPVPQRIGIALVPRGNAIALPASGTNGSSGQKAMDIQGTCSPPNARLAKTSMVPAGHRHEHQGA